jgi:TonB family protein
VRPGASSLPVFVGLLAISAAAHIVAFAALRSQGGPPADRPREIAPTDSWELLASTRPQAPPLEAMPAAAALPPAIESAPIDPPSRPRAPRPASRPTLEHAELHGRTLTSDRDDANWSSEVGNGAALRDAEPEFKPPSPPPQPRLTAEEGPSVVPFASLSRKPQAPAGLDGLLRRFYPRRARSQGIEGAVTVRMRVLPSGRVSEIRVLDERPAGFEFAVACRQMLLAAPPFVPPLDRAGQRVASDVPFRCTFEVDH